MVNDLPGGFQLFCRLISDDTRTGGKGADVDLIKWGLNKKVVRAVINALLLNVVKCQYLHNVTSLPPITLFTNSIGGAIPVPQAHCKKNHGVLVHC